jgi:two-component system, cell cycle sensor histidine kinase and response regulator CckA
MKILHVEDNPLDAELTRSQLLSELPGCSIAWVETKSEYIDRLQQQSFDVVLSDFGLVEFDGLEALALAKQHAPGKPFVFLSGNIGEELAIEIMRAGAKDYILKDRPWRLAAALTRAVQEAEEKQHREAAEQANQRLVAILESTPDFVGITSTDQHLLYVNLAGRRLTGLPETGPVGRITLGDLCPPSHELELRERIFPHVLRHGSWTGELALQNPEGGVTPVSGVLLAHRSADGRMDYLSAMLRDLTAQKAADRRIREQAEFLKRASEIIFVEDNAGRITFWNQGAENTLGWTAAEAIGQPAQEIIRPAAEGVMRIITKALQRDGEWHGELPVFDKAGRRRVLEAGFTIMPAEAGAGGACLSISTDVSEKKVLEEKFLRAQRLESIGMLATGIAHDLNNVLAPVLLGVTMLRERGLEEDVMKVLGSLERSAERGAALVRQILGFAHGIGGEHRVFEIRHLLRDVASVARETFPRSIRIEQEVERHLWPINANPTQIHQVLLNLVVNARDAMPGGGVLSLRADNHLVDEATARKTPGARPGSFLAVYVSDTGTGIAPEVQAHMWEPFFTTKGPGKGTGLGLATVRGIVESHGGFITVDTSKAGTTFNVFLPASEDAFGQEQTVSDLAAPRGNGELILLVDDELHVRELAASVLSHHGYRVLSARDGIEAVAMFAPRSDEIRLVVTDIQMPNLDGVALAAIIRRLNPAAKLIAASGIDDRPAAGAHPLAQLADAVLPKPFKAEALLHCIHRLLHPGEHPRD